MKIGIVTFWNSEDNYGQVLQCYALQRFLRNKGHDAFVIRYVPSHGRNLRWWMNLPIKIVIKAFQRISNSSEYNFSRRLKQQKKIVSEENSKHPRHFSLFKNRYIKYSPKIYDSRTIFENPPEADVYIAGSDQIWGWLDPGFYLQFVPKGKLCIAYAPSFGGVLLSKRKKNILRRYLERFSILAMREQNGVDICRSVGRDDAFGVLDPTLLLPLKDYISCMNFIDKANDDYILLYLLGNDIDLEISVIYEWAKLHNLKIRYVASQGRVDSYEKSYPNVDEWLGLVYRAKYVITNSFHGMIFSIIMKKKFVVIPLCKSYERMNCRIRDLLSLIHLTHRIYMNDMDLLLSDIDYGDVESILSLEQEKMSFNFDKWLSES